MLDPRLYRAALAPVLFAVILAAFSLQDQPRPVRTTLAPDAFVAARAFRDLQDMAAQAPGRRPGSPGDEAIARRVARTLTAAGPPGGSRPFSVRQVRFRGETIDGERELTNVIATRAGAPGPQIVVVAHRDAAARGSVAELSGTAALLELGRVLAVGNMKRTITLVSTSGGSGGAAGARALAKQLSGSVDGVLVLGATATRRHRRPWVVSYSNGGGLAPLELTRTVQEAIRFSSHSEPGAPRAITQWARLALPLTISEQGELNRAGLGAVLLSSSGERPPAPNAAVDQGTLGTFGRAALRTVLALDGGPDVDRSSERFVITQRKVLPEWAVRILVASLLLAPLLVAVDGFARLRRRREPVGRGLALVGAAALPFALAGAFALVLGGTGLIDATPPAPVPEGAIPRGGAADIALLSVVLVFVLGWLVLRPLVARMGGLRDAAAAPGTAGAALLVMIAVALVAWIVNPYAAALALPALHAWLPVLAPGVRLRRAAALGLLAIGLVPFVGVALADARSLGLGPLDTAWMALLVVAGGHVGALAWLWWSLFAGAVVVVGAIAVRPPEPAPPPEAEPALTVRGPAGYAGPGSLGGTESALRR